MITVMILGGFCPSDAFEVILKSLIAGSHCVGPVHQEDIHVFAPTECSPIQKRALSILVFGLNFVNVEGVEILAKEIVKVMQGFCSAKTRIDCKLAPMRGGLGLQKNTFWISHEYIPPTT